MSAFEEEECKVLVRFAILYDFKAGLKASESHQQITQAFGEIVGESTVRRWFRKFKDGEFDLNDKPRAGRPLVLDTDELRQVVEADPRQTTRELAERFGVDQSTIDRPLHALVWARSASWAPHELSPEHRLMRVEIATSLLSLGRNHVWLRDLTTDVEKWVLYANVRRRRSWVDKGAAAAPTPKPELHQKKIMLCIWWNSEGVIHFEFLPENSTVTAEVYFQQLERLTDAMPPTARKILLHDNARPHVAQRTRSKLLELGWEVLPHPPYSSDLAPTDLHLFRSLEKFLNGKNFETIDQVQYALHSFTEGKNSDRFTEHGFFRFPLDGSMLLSMTEIAYLTSFSYLTLCTIGVE